jgi:hypothetical protein
LKEKFLSNVRQSGGRAHLRAAISVLTRAIFDDSRFVPLSGSRIFA